MTIPAGFDPLDARAGIPHEGLRTLRREAPVFRTPAGIVYLALQDDVLAATQDIETFVASFREPGVVVRPEEMLLSEIPEPRHGAMRRIVNSAIAAHRLGRVAPFAREITESHLQPIVDRGAGELIEELVMPIPNAVIAHLLGAPAEDFHLWARWSDEVVASDYPAKNRTARGEGLAGAFPEFAAYVDGMIAERQDAVGAPDDFIARLVHTEIEGRRLSSIELRTTLIFLLISGNETTRHLLGNLLATMARNPDAFRRIREDRSLIIAAVDESLRLDPPVAVLLRNCVRDTEVRGVAIRAGEKVAFGLASANRDERHYEEPDAFRLDRPQPKAHLAFGGGPHVCPGAVLARLEGRVLLDVLADRVERIELPAGWRPQPVPVFWANGHASLPAKLVRAA